MKKVRLEILIFIVEFVYMILELVASRILSPYFGNSNFVWTSVIGIILLSTSIGNFLGGKIADKYFSTKILKIIIIFISVFVLIIPFIYQFFLVNISASVLDIKIGAIISTIILFFIPSLGIGMITPNILKLKLIDLENVGKVSGKINAIGTIGGIVGTFVGGFALIPLIGSIYTMYILVCILVISILLVDLKFKDLVNLFIIPILIISLVSLSVTVVNDNKNRSKILSNSQDVSYNFDTDYGHVNIYNSYYGGELVRCLSVNSGMESATFLEESKVNELVFDYTKYYDLMFETSLYIKNVLMIGGGGYSYPKYFISHYDRKYMDVVEIDPKITQVARDYFFLDKLFEDYNLNETHRLNCITADGRVYLNNNEKKYDAILNDAFLGNALVATLTTLEAVRLIKGSLNTNGVYMSNIIASIDGSKSKFLSAEINTLKQEFKYVYIVPVDTFDRNTVQNLIVIACDQYLELTRTILKDIPDDELILTDEHCPTDLLYI